MNTFFAWIFGFIFSGYLLKAYCPEPTTLPQAIQDQHTLALAGQAPMPEAYAQLREITTRRSSSSTSESV